MLTMLLLPFASLLLLCCCRFADCMHLAEPGCAVTEAELERHEHYVKFLAEVKVRAEW
jgi:putative ribosome biogenesis GTPase RsgA